MPKLFVDANIVAEMLLNRPKAQLCYRWLADHDHQLHISALTVHILLYLSEKDHHDRNIIRLGLDPYLVLAVNAQTIELAWTRYDSRDFEDCLQAAAAELGGCEQILTLDRRFAKHSSTTLDVKVLN